MKKAENIALWNNRFTDRKASGLKVDEWCAKNNVSRHAYYYWHRKVQDIPQHASEKMFLEIPVTTSEEKSKTEQEGIVINWKGFSFCIKDFQEIPLITDLMQRLVNCSFSSQRDFFALIKQLDDLYNLPLRFFEVNYADIPQTVHFVSSSHVKFGG